MARTCSLHIEHSKISFRSRLTFTTLWFESFTFSEFYRMKLLVNTAITFHSSVPTCTASIIFLFLWDFRFHKIVVKMYVFWLKTACLPSFSGSSYPKSIFKQEGSSEMVITIYRTVRTLIFISVNNSHTLPYKEEKQSHVPYNLSWMKQWRACHFD